MPLTSMTPCILAVTLSDVSIRLAFGQARRKQAWRKNAAIPCIKKKNKTNKNTKH